jgi:hypothetical protein
MDEIQHFSLAANETRCPGQRMLFTLGSKTISAHKMVLLCTAVSLKSMLSEDVNIYSIRALVSSQCTVVSRKTENCNWMNQKKDHKI